MGELQVKSIIARGMCQCNLTVSIIPAIMVMNWRQNMPLTLHYECDVCKQLQDPRGLSWERQASSININIAGAWPQTEHKWNTVCPSCALIINDAINSALTKLKPQHIKK